MPAINSIIGSSVYTINPVDRAPLKDRITLENWRDEAHEYECPRCGAGVDAWKTDHNPNNNAYSLVCRCGESHPLRDARVIYLKHSQKRRREAPPESTADTWERCGGYCYGCGQPTSALVVLGVGRHQHHTKPYAEYGHDGTLIPLCGWCHDAISLVQRIMGHIGHTMEAHE